MLRTSRLVVLGGALLWATLAPATANAQAATAAPTPQVIPIWPEGVPGALENATPEVVEEGGARISNVHVPTVSAYLAPRGLSNGTAVIVCPGGGYTRLAFDHEGDAVAKWLNGLGISAFVLKYRLKEYGHPAPLRDVLRAIRLVRSQAATWNVEPSRIGVLGFSAGGHLASSAATLFEAPEGRTGAPLDRVSARPDFAILVYPVISLKPPYYHAGSKVNLVGEQAPADLVDHLSTDLQVTKNTPPTFLVHGGTDTAVPAENSVLFYSALRRAGVPAEMHLYQEGPHGIGLRPGYGAMSEWPARCAEWMKQRGLVR